MGWSPDLGIGPMICGVRWLSIRGSVVRKGSRWSRRRIDRVGSIGVQDISRECRR